MSFFRSLKSSVYNPAFYAEVAKQSFSEAFSFFLKYVLLLSVVASLVFTAFFGAFLYGGGLDKVTGGIASLYPEDLSITVKDGSVSVNQEQPYGVPMPLGVSTSGSEEEYDYLVVFDTEYPVTMEALKEYKTAVLVGENSIGVLNRNTGQLRVIEIPKDANMVIDRAEVENVSQSVAGYIKQYGLWVAIVVLPIGLFIGLFIGILVYLIFASLLIWLVASVKKLSYTYAQSYKAGMYLIVLPQAMTTLLSFVTMFIPFFRTILVVVLAIVNLKSVETSAIISDPSAPEGMAKTSSAEVIENQNATQKIEDVSDDAKVKESDRGEEAK